MSISIENQCEVYKLSPTMSLLITKTADLLHTRRWFNKTYKNVNRKQFAVSNVIYLERKNCGTIYCIH